MLELPSTTRLIKQHDSTLVCLICTPSSGHKTDSGLPAGCITTIIIKEKCQHRKRKLFSRMPRFIVMHSTAQMCMAVSWDFFQSTGAVWLYGLADTTNDSYD